LGDNRNEKVNGFRTVRGMSRVSTEGAITVPSAILDDTKIGAGKGVTAPDKGEKIKPGMKR